MRTLARPTSAIFAVPSRVRRTLCDFRSNKLHAHNKPCLTTQQTIRQTLHTQAQEIPSDRGPHVTLGKIQNCAMIAMQSVQLRLVERKMIEARFLHKWQHESQRAGA